jgi:hypothetical protein
MSRVLQAGFTGLAAIILLSGTALLQPAAARIQCQGEFQVTQYGLIATPYCGDEVIARVAHSYGWREAATVRTNPLSKVYICKHWAGIGDSNRLALDTYPMAAAGTKAESVTTKAKPTPDGALRIHGLVAVAVRAPRPHAVNPAPITSTAAATAATTPKEEADATAATATVATSSTAMAPASVAAASAADMRGASPAVTTSATTMTTAAAAMTAAAATMSNKL